MVCIKDTLVNFLKIVFKLMWKFTKASLNPWIGGAGGDDGSAGADQDQQDTAPEPADPNLVAPTNKQGYGRDVDTSLTKAQTKALKISVSTQPPIGEQSILAMQQFAVLVRDHSNIT